MDKVLIKRIIFTSLTVLWMIMIFMFSNQSADASTGSSKSFTKKTIITIYKLFDKDASEERLNEIVDMLDPPVRKFGHFTEFLVLGILVFATLKAYGINNLYIAILICFLYSCSDEIHQLFITGRSGNILDITIDTFGSICGILILNKFMKK